MRFLLSIAVISASLCGAASLAAQQAAPQKDTRPGVAVLPFANGGSYGPNREDLGPLEVGVQEILTSELAQNSGLRVVERRAIKQLLDELKLTRDKQVDPATAARIGKLVGARYMVLGGFTDAFGKFRLDGRIVDTETSEILKSDKVAGQTSDMYSTIVDLAGKIMVGVHLQPLPATQTQTRRARAIPSEAISLFSRAQVFQDNGHPDKAIELYKLISEKFPQMTEAKQALRQLGQT